MSENKPAVASVKMRKGETIESLLRRFTRQLKKSGGLEDIKEKGPGRRFKSKRTLRVEKEKASAKRRKQAQRRANRKRKLKARQMKDV